jgi:ABC-type multidrug transport system ATPase subunit
MTEALGPMAPAVTLARDDEETARSSMTAAPGEPRLVARGVRKAYRGQLVLDGIDLSFFHGSSVAISGGNGVGKSTLLSCLAGTIRHEGEVLLDGEKVGPSTRGRIAYLPQRLRLPATSSGREVLRLFAAIGGGGADRVTPPADFLPDLDKPVGQLSGGQAQRVGLAAVMQGSPDLVLLDEPFANLDDDARVQARELLQDHRDAGATILVASPTAQDLLASLDRVVLIGTDGIAFDGTADQYAGRLEMTIWVRPGDVSIDRIDGLDEVRASRREGDWLALECRRDDASALLRDLDAIGIRTEEVLFARPAETGSAGMSTGAASGDGR